MHAPINPRVVPGCWGPPITLREFVPHDCQMIFRQIDRELAGKKKTRDIPQLDFFEFRRLVKFAATPSEQKELRLGIWHESWVGTIALKLPSPAEGELSYWIGSEFRNQGYAPSATITLVRYAFDVLKLPKIIAHVLHANLGSQKVLGRAGFHVEAPGAGWYTCAIKKPAEIPAK